MAGVPIWKFGLELPKLSVLEVTFEGGLVLSGLVVVQDRLFMLQVLNPRAMLQKLAEGVSVPDMLADGAQVLEEELQTVPEVQVAVTVPVEASGLLLLYKVKVCEPGAPPGTVTAWVPDWLAGVVLLETVQE